MPRPVCISCNTSQSLLWRPCEDGQICQECYAIEGTEADKFSKDQEDEASAEEQKDKEKIVGEKEKEKEKEKDKEKEKEKGGKRSSSKSGRCKTRGRRSMLKRTPYRAPAGTATVVTSESVYHKGSYMQIGDVVSLTGTDDCVYYAQIRGFVQDQYCEKSAAVTWLLPTKASPPPDVSFDPATYIIGPEEELPRRLDCMDFVMHAPSDYYRSRVDPYPPVVADAVSRHEGGYVWTSLESRDR